MALEQLAIPPSGPEHEPDHMDDDEQAEISFVHGREEVQLGRLKAQLVELAFSQVSHCFRSKGVEPQEEEIQQFPLCKSSLTALTSSRILFLPDLPSLL